MDYSWLRPLQPLWSLFLKGLAAVLPLGITVYLLYWLGHTAENLFGAIVRAILPEALYFPGLGILLAIATVIVIGLVIQQWMVSQLVKLGEELLHRIPVINTVYAGIRDIMDFISRAGRRRDMSRVVFVELWPGWRSIGFVTDEDAGTNLPEVYQSERIDEGTEIVAVYVPLSYQIGGLTLWLPRADVEELDLSVEDAMRVVLTAGVNRPRRGG